MIARNEERRPELKFQVMDCTSLEYDSDYFDVIIDKSTIDCLVCGTQAYKKVAMMMKECQRVLKTGGYFVSISFGQPASRELHFQRPHLKMTLETVKIVNPNNRTPVVSILNAPIKIPLANNFLLFSRTTCISAGSLRKQIISTNSTGIRLWQWSREKRLSRATTRNHLMKRT